MGCAILALLSASLRLLFYFCFSVGAGDKASHPSNRGCCEILVSNQSARKGRVGVVHAVEVDELCVHAGGA